MTTLYVIAGMILALILVYLWMLKGRTGHKNLAPLAEFFYAHRGYHAKPTIPENSMAAFERAVLHGYGAELDVHLLKDGTVAVMHDSALLRTTGCEGDIEDLTLEQLTEYRLEESDETIPTLRQVLDLFEEKTPLIIELKTKDDNVAPLCEAVCKELEGYRGLYCIESFDPRCVLWFKKNHPEVMRGQLSCNFMKEHTGYSVWVAFVLTYLLWNVVSRPDFIAYDFAARNNISNRICQKIWKIAPVYWTLKNETDFELAKEEGAICIFEQFEAK